MPKVIIRYKVRPDEVRQNIALLLEFFKELEIAPPPDLTYEAYILEDGVSFVQIVDSPNGAQSFGHLSSYRKYRDTVAARCINPPEMVTMTTIGCFSKLAD